MGKEIGGLFYGDDSLLYPWFVWVTKAGRQLTERSGGTVFSNPLGYHFWSHGYAFIIEDEQAKWRTLSLLNFQAKYN